MELSSTAAAQGGVFTREQARLAGWSAYRIARRLQTGEWVELFGGRVLRGSGTVMTPDSWSHAAVLATAPGSVLAGPSAARLHGIKIPAARPCVLVPPTRRRTPTGLIAIRDAISDHDCALIDGLVVTSRPRTVVDCLLLLPEMDGRTLLDRALQQRWLTLDELVLRTHLHASRHGAPKLRKHVTVASYGVRSEAERLLRRLLLSAGITGWRADYPLAGVGVLDFAFPDVQLAIEVDGRAWHSAGDRFQRDRTRQNLAVAAGWTVLRFTWDDLTRRPDEVIATIRSTLARP